MFGSIHYDLVDKRHKVDLEERNYEPGRLGVSSRALSGQTSVHYLVSRTLTESHLKCRAPAIEGRAGGNRQRVGHRGVGQINPRPAAFPLRYCVATQNTYANDKSVRRRN